MQGEARKMCKGEEHSRQMQSSPKGLSNTVLLLSVLHEWSSDRGEGSGVGRDEAWWGWATSKLRLVEQGYELRLIIVQSKHNGGAEDSPH